MQAPKLHIFSLRHCDIAATNFRARKFEEDFAIRTQIQRLNTLDKRSRSFAKVNTAFAALPNPEPHPNLGGSR